MYLISCGKLKELKGKTLGIVGFGSIGKKLVPIAKAFGINVIYTNTSGEVSEFSNDMNVNFVDFENILAKSDFLVLLVPLTTETKHMITSSELGKMKSTSILLNMARGPVVKEQDLVDALNKKIISGACLDVYEFEPKVSDELKSMDNVVLTPHTGSATVEARDRMAKCAAQNVIDVLSLGECKNIVNK